LLHTYVATYTSNIRVKVAEVRFWVLTCKQRPVEKEDLDIDHPKLKEGTRFPYHPGIHNEDFNFFQTGGYWCLTVLKGSRLHATQETSYLGKITQFLQYGYGIDPNNSNSGTQRFSPTKHQYLTGDYNFDSLPPLLMLIIHSMHSPIYKNVHTNRVDLPLG
jgi:hypothetical protein